MSVIIVPECLQEPQIQDLTIKHITCQQQEEPPDPIHHQCPQCGVTSNQSAIRLVHDTCGHLKCRLCLLKEENGCMSCEEERIKIYENAQFQTLEPAPPIEQVRSPVIEERAPVLVHTMPIPQPSELSPPPPPRSESTPSPPPVPENEKNKKKRKSMKIDDHIIVIPGNPPTYKCSICTKSFKTRNHIHYHESCVSGKKPYHCDQCNQGFNSKAHFEYHQRNHQGIRPFVCPDCNKTFNQKGKLTRHMRLHTGERPFVCHLCGKGFSNAQALNNHNLVHSGEKPHVCVHCDKRFSELSNLKKHTMTHTNYKPYMCEDCGKAFSLHWALNLHRRTHTRERDFICPNCSKAFSNNRDLRRHSLVHTNIRPHSCPVCNVAIRRKDNLERHMRNTHPEVSNIEIPIQVEQTPVQYLPINLEPPRNNAVPVINSAPPASVQLQTVHLPPPQQPLALNTQQCHGYTTRNLHPENSPHLFIASKNLTPM